MFAAAKKRPKVKYFCTRERGQFSLIHLPPYSPRRDNFKEKIGGIEEGHPWHVLLNFGDCKLFNLSAAALFRNQNFRRDCRFLACGLVLVTDENDDFIKQSCPPYTTLRNQSAAGL